MFSGLLSLVGGLGSVVKSVFSGGGEKTGSNNVMEIASGIGNFIDEQKFTDQEKAVNVGTVIIPAMQKFMDSTVGENTQRSKARREIALWIMRNWIVMLWASIVSFGVELIVENTKHEMSSFILGIATMSAMMTYLVLGVGGFFFGAHIIRQMPKKNQPPS